MSSKKKTSKNVDVDEEENAVDVEEEKPKKKTRKISTKTSKKKNEKQEQNSDEHVTEKKNKGNEDAEDEGEYSYDEQQHTDDDELFEGEKNKRNLRPKDIDMEPFRDMNEELEKYSSEFLAGFLATRAFDNREDLFFYAMRDVYNALRCKGRFPFNKRKRNNFKPRDRQYTGDYRYGERQNYLPNNDGPHARDERFERGDRFERTFDSSRHDDRRPKYDERYPREYPRHVDSRTYRR